MREMSTLRRSADVGVDMYRYIAESMAYLPLVNSSE